MMRQPELVPDRTTVKSAVKPFAEKSNGMSPLKKQLNKKIEKAREKGQDFLMLGGGRYAQTELGYGKHVVHVKSTKEDSNFVLFTELGMIVQEIRNEDGMLSEYKRIINKEFIDQIGKGIALGYDNIIDDSKKIINAGLKRAKQFVDLSTKEIIDTRISTGKKSTVIIDELGDIKEFLKK